MTVNHPLGARLRQALLGLAVVVAMLPGGRTRAEQPGRNPWHVPNDWSHRHLVFSLPTSLPQLRAMQNEPRYWHQWARQNAWALRPASSEINNGGRDRDADGKNAAAAERRKEKPHELHRDWAVSLGAGATGGAGQFPAKFTFDVTAAPDCSADYVAFTTSLVGSATTPSIVAFDNLYSMQPAAGGFCNNAGPTVKWAYNTNPAGDVTGTALTSPVLALSGGQIAFVESRTNANGGSILHILKWKPGAAFAVQGTIAAPATPDTVLAAGQAWNTTNCPAANSCIVNIVFNGSQADTGSAPFYNYGTDELYVGDDNGVLHKFTGVFSGTPAEVTTSGWPITVNAGAVLTGPVFDVTSHNIFVADHTGRLSFIKEVGSTTGACGAGVPPCLGSVSQSLTGSIVDPPLVDSTTGRVLVFDGTETSANHGSIFQFDTALTAASQVTVGIGGAAVVAGDVTHAGTFDDAYFSVGPASGHLYTCGKDPAFNNRPAIYQHSFNAAGVLQTAGIPGPLVGLAHAYSFIGDACSPVSELKNGATDRIFFSFVVNAFAPPSGSATGCVNGQGCVAMVLLGGAWPPAATTAGFAVPTLAVGQGGNGGTSGIVIDNTGAGAQESSLYFTFRTNSTTTVTCNGTTGVGCAVKLTQSALN